MARLQPRHGFSDGYHLEASDRIVDFRISGEDTSESSNGKRKIESLFCVMRKRNRRDKSDDDMIVDDYFCFSGSDTDVSECSEFDVLSEYVLEEDMDLKGELEDSKSLPICNFPWLSVDEEALVSSDEANGVRSNALCCSINKEDSEIPCNSDIFKIDEDESSEIEVRDGDVVNLPLSMEEMSSSDELRRLWNKDYPIPICILPPVERYCGNELRLWNRHDDPIPINIVPPDDESSFLLEPCPLHRIISCGNDDKIGLEMSSIPLTKTLEGPSRPWSACGCLATDKNLPLMEDSSGTCSHMDDQLHEDSDAELVQTPSTLYQDEDEICFSEIDAMIRKLNLLPDDSESCLNKEEWNIFNQPTHKLLELEHCTKTSMRRAIMSQRALAVLHCRDSKHYIKKHEVSIGRSSDGVNVDIDLSKTGYGSKISRRQALLKLENYGSFSLKNLGKRHIHVNGEKLDTGQIITLTPSSLIDIRGIVFMVKINKEAVRKFLKKNNNTKRNNNNKDNTKFKWCE